MTTEKKAVLNRWLIGIALTIAIPLVTWSYANISDVSEIRTKTESNTQRIDKLENETVKKTEFELVIKQLDRIEDKLDKLQNEKK